MDTVDIAHAILLKFMLEFISRERGRCGVLWISGTMNSGHVTKRVCVHVCTSRSSKCDFVLLELLALVASRNTTVLNSKKDFFEFFIKIHLWYLNTLMFTLNNDL